MKKTATDFIQTNEEYVKLRNSRAPGVDIPPRETPSGQAPGRKGHTKPGFEDWTTEELRSLAETLRISDTQDCDHATLIDLISARDANLHREAGDG